MRDTYIKMTFEILNGDVKGWGPAEDIIHDKGGVGASVYVYAVWAQDFFPSMI